MRLISIELTNKCNLECIHCYASSSPKEKHPDITLDQYKEIISDAVSLGCNNIQFIGGEPTLSPHLYDLLEYSSTKNLSIEVFTNLVSLPKKLISAFKKYDVKLATSFYSGNSENHDKVTLTAGSHKKTLSNINIIKGEDIPIRVGVIDVLGDKKNYLSAKRQIGAISKGDIGYDGLRGIGRGKIGQEDEMKTSELCGRCAGERICLTHNGNFIPCPMARKFVIGNIKERGLLEIYNSPTHKDTRLEIYNHTLRKKWA